MNDDPNGYQVLKGLDTLTESVCPLPNNSMELAPKRMLFISMDWYRTKDPRTPLAMASIQAYFRAHQHEPVESEFISFDLADDAFDIHQVIESVLVYQPDFIAWGVYIWNETQTQQLLQAIDQHRPTTKVILGGPQVTFAEHGLDQDYPRADFFIKGAGEQPFTWLIDQLAACKTLDSNEMRHRAIYSRQMIQTESCHTIFNSPLAELVSPYLSDSHPIQPNQPFVRWETTRGCPYRCNFCQFRSEGIKPKPIPSGRILQELELFHTMNVQEIHVLDPIFNMDPRHYQPILQKIQDLGMKAKFFLQCRLELLLKPGGQEFLTFCKEYGNVLLEFGVQTFNEQESQAVKRGNRYDEIYKALALLQECKIPFDLHLIFGLPHQTIEDFRRSYETAVATRPQGLYLYPLNLLKGTELQVQATDHGYQWDTADYNTFTQSNWMTRDEVASLKQFAHQVNAIAKQRLPGVEYPGLVELTMKV